MPTPTYDLIEEKVLGSAQASVTFSSIPGTYKDLIIEVTGTGTAAATMIMSLNSDTGGNYSRTYLYGDGSSAISGRQANTNGMYLDIRTEVGTLSANVFSYANTNVNKTILARGSFSATFAIAYVGTWRNTAAVTTMKLEANATTFASGCTFRLWGVSG